MAIKELKPVNSSSRFQSFPTFEEITSTKPNKRLTKGKNSSGGRNNKGQLTQLVARRRSQAEVSRDRLQARQARHPGEGGDASSTTRTVRRASRCCSYADGEKRYILCPLGLKVGDTVSSGEAVEVNVGNALPLAQDPARHHGAQHRAQARQGRSDGAQRRRRRAVDGQGRHLRAGEAALGRSAQGERRTATPRSARSATSTTRTSRSARPGGAAGWARSRTTAA